MSTPTARKTAARKTAAAQPEPPAAAVAADAHWSATRERLRSRIRPTATLTICDDQQAKKAREAADFQMRHAKARREDGQDDAESALTAAQAELAAAQAAFDEAAIVLHFQALERPLFEALKRKYPATEEQAEDGSAFNIEAMAPELIAASSLDGITEDDARHYLDTWAEGEAAALFNAAWGVQGETRMDVGKG
ncbi:hypothetical protein AB0D12_31640 [Streptomyces sp. NPDC048479]|uniref:hypothetical protein n=1 Tax=Streptomyces sp. NPDC048479 TaxID=3154725 RepID=UPI00344012EB